MFSIVSIYCQIFLRSFELAERTITMYRWISFRMTNSYYDRLTERFIQTCTTTRIEELSTFCQRRKLPIQCSLATNPPANNKRGAAMFNKLCISSHGDIAMNTEFIASNRIH